MWLICGILFTLNVLNLENNLKACVNAEITFEKKNVE